MWALFERVWVLCLLKETMLLKHCTHITGGGYCTFKVSNKRQMVKDYFYQHYQVYYLKSIYLCVSFIWISDCKTKPGALCLSLWLPGTIYILSSIFSYCSLWNPKQHHNSSLTFQIPTYLGLNECQGDCITHLQDHMNAGYSKWLASNGVVRIQLRITLYAQHMWFFLSQDCCYNVFWVASQPKPFFSFFKKDR